MRNATPSAHEIAIAVARAPTIFAACQRVAAQNGERCTSEDFTIATRRFSADQLKQTENRFAALSPRLRDAMVTPFMNWRSR